MISITLLAALHLTEPDIEFVDSRDDNKVTYVIVGEDCKVKIQKSELHDYDAVVEKVLKLCGF